ncbi:hypothetical protein VIOR3934_19770 [Vibrio orientalis CIP 102891 = ATCC 33934]|uniref:Uncharacterized protein n=2 Tax=Vibrio orientalis TaxID=28175 RepID=F9SMP4_VIBOR|nr:hypothetical protein VIOR3934_19770 [Vibrio orientalis CIP 102891 = ATCC 33934]
MWNAAFLTVLLSGCSSRTDAIQTRVIVQLPPAGLIVPCEKPNVKGTWPEIATEDIPRLKDALGRCADQTQDYLNWRAEQQASLSINKG